jgi:hypothetical protein
MSFEAVHAGYGRVLVNGTLSVKALFVGQLFRLHRRHNRRVLRLPVPGRLARRPLRGPRHADPREQRAPPGARNRSMLLPRRSLRRAHWPGRAASCPAGRAGPAMTGASVPRLRPPPGGARG